MQNPNQLFPITRSFAVKNRPFEAQPLPDFEFPKWDIPFLPPTILPNEPMPPLMPVSPSGFEITHPDPNTGEEKPMSQLLWSIGWARVFRGKIVAIYFRHNHLEQIIIIKVINIANGQIDTVEVRLPEPMILISDYILDANLFWGEWGTSGSLFENDIGFSNVLYIPIRISKSKNTPMFVFKFNTINYDYSFICIIDKSNLSFVERKYFLFNLFKINIIYFVNETL